MQLLQQPLTFPVVDRLEVEVGVSSWEKQLDRSAEEAEEEFKKTKRHLEAKLEENKGKREVNKVILHIRIILFDSV